MADAAKAQARNELWAGGKGRFSMGDKLRIERVRHLIADWQERGITAVAMPALVRAIERALR